MSEQKLYARASEVPGDSQSVDDPLTRYRTAQRQAEERAAWDGYAAAAIAADVSCLPRDAAIIADGTLQLRRERFPT